MKKLLIVCALFACCPRAHAADLRIVVSTGSRQILLTVAGANYKIITSTALQADFNALSEDDILQLVAQLHKKMIVWNVTGVTLPAAWTAAYTAIIQELKTRTRADGSPMISANYPETVP